MAADAIMGRAAGQPAWRSGQVRGKFGSMLIAFGGLPATGKTTLARAVAAERSAAYLRVDVIEQALRESGTLANEVGRAGYAVGYAVAESNLRLGVTVVADSVNPLPVTRAAWRAVARRAGVPCLEVEVVCTDPAEHRRRAETRAADIPGLAGPSWAEITRRDYAAWESPRLVLDTARLGVPAALDALRTAMANLAGA
ncbi:AAA family ATPase [Muricoccus radiodurans]|uniref:AAA family ATPase n=1 Tax=Muricoccus radiodurans TaxID=2231721 RepID=UPI003CFA16F5